MAVHKITLRHPEPWEGGRASPVAMDERPERYVASPVIYAISILICLDSMQRGCEADGHSQSQLDAITRRSSPARMAELGDHLSRALRIIEKALK